MSIDQDHLLEDKKNNIWLSEFSKHDNTSEIDLSDGINDIAELDALLSEVTPELFELLGRDTTDLFNLLKIDKDEVSCIEMENLIAFLEMLDENQDGILSSQEILLSLDKDNNKKIDIDELSVAFEALKALD